MHTISIRRIGIVSAVLGFAALMLVVLPAFAAAQQDDLRATIRAQLLSDPRTSTLSPQQLDAMVDILVEQAQEQGVSASDLTWRPQQEFTGTPYTGEENGCGAMPRFLCVFNQAFGFAGNDPTIPFVLGGAAMALVWLFAHMLHHKQYHPLTPLGKQ